MIYRVQTLSSDLIGLDRMYMSDSWSHLHGRLHFVLGHMIAAPRTIKMWRKGDQRERKNPWLTFKNKFDEDGIRTHAGKPNGLAVHRLNHSATSSHANNVKFSNDKALISAQTSFLDRLLREILDKSLLSYTGYQSHRGGHFRFPSQDDSLCECRISVIKDGTIVDPSDRWVNLSIDSSGDILSIEGNCHLEILAYRDYAASEQNLEFVRHKERGSTSHISLADIDIVNNTAAVDNSAIDCFYRNGTQIPTRADSLDRDILVNVNGGDDIDKDVEIFDTKDIEVSDPRDIEISDSRYELSDPREDDFSNPKKDVRVSNLGIFVPLSNRDGIRIGNGNKWPRTNILGNYRLPVYNIDVNGQTYTIRENHMERGKTKRQPS
ncbi:uncharacterized protein LOC135922591 [Gordionus sp. m RMFG-2023]|uniref:uncharacterized protein LOC135922591 n=1 Tax=Gordionus sp. m RMFG-2023 TaxID=3053472 RepID=UPI0031FC1A35